MIQDVGRAMTDDEAMYFVLGFACGVVVVWLVSLLRKWTLGRSWR
jgi:hypothetical protein